MVEWLLDHDRVYSVFFPETLNVNIMPPSHKSHTIHNTITIIQILLEQKKQESIVRPISWKSSQKLGVKTGSDEVLLLDKKTGRKSNIYVQYIFYLFSVGTDFHAGWIGNNNKDVRVLWFLLHKLEAHGVLATKYSRKINRGPRSTKILQRKPWGYRNIAKTKPKIISRLTNVEVKFVL